MAKTDEDNVPGLNPDLEKYDKGKLPLFDENISTEPSNASHSAPPPNEKERNKKAQDGADSDGVGSPS